MVATTSFLAKKFWREEANKRARFRNSFFDLDAVEKPCFDKARSDIRSTALI
jgi:hypothetical protein